MLIAKRRAEAKHMRKMQKASNAALGVDKLTTEEINRAKKLSFTKHLAIPLLYVPAALLMVYSVRSALAPNSYTVKPKPCLEPCAP